ncbi:MAG: hypothetical protein Q8O04_06940 [Deltaproteobacteria bacterium]|nr:hypothetical protein [Deltaproteobacteria bacterium]
MDKLLKVIAGRASGRFARPSASSTEANKTPALPGLWRVVIALAVLITYPGSSARAVGIGGTADLRYNSTKQKKDGVKVSDGYTFSQNYNLNLADEITPVLSYTLNFRANNNKTSTTQDSTATKTYSQGAEPQIEFSLHNPFYNASAGYQRTERWSGASLADEIRKTGDYTYARFDISPRDLPTLALQWGHKRDFDYLSPTRLDTTTDTYLLNTSYNYAPFRLYYNYYLTQTTDDAPSGNIYRAEREAHTHNGRLDYSQSFFDGKLPVNAGYNANHNRNISDIFSTAAVVTVKRTPFLGIYKHDTASPPTPTILTLETQNLLIDGEKKPDDRGTNINVGYTGLPNWDSSSNLQHNIGLELTSTKSVKTIRIYTNIPATNTSFNDTLEFTVYSGATVSNWNKISTLASPAPSKSVTEDVYFYEVSFPAKEARFFKVVNTKETATANVYITEIEVFGDETEKTDITERFDQGLNFNTSLKARPDLSVLFSFYLTRNDEEPPSLPEAAGNLFSTVFSKTKKGGEGISKGTTTRSWGPSINWQPYSKILTSFRFQRQDSWDTEETTDSASNTYAFSLNSPLLDTLDTTFSATRSEQYSFSEKQTLSNSFLFSTLAKLYDGVNMVTDLNYTTSESFQTNTTTDTLSLNGNINTTLTRRLNGTFTYGFSWPSPGAASNQQSLVLTYRPGALLNFMASFQAADTGTAHTFGQNYSIDWLPVPVLNFRLSAQETESGDTKTQTLTFQSRWQTYRYMDFQFNYSLGRVESSSRTDTHTWGLSFTGRF